MIKKCIKTIIIGGVWTILYLFVTEFLFINIWHFDYLSPRHWHTINTFWQNGGVIKTAGDYLFLLSLLLLFPLWYWGLKFAYKLNYISILLWPFTAYNKILIERYKKSYSRIVLKNIGTSTKVEEEIKQKTSAIKPQEYNNADKIRDAINQKLLSEQNKKNQ